MIDLSQANGRLEEFARLIQTGEVNLHEGPLYVGVDLGTANIVSAVVDGQGKPVAGVLTKSRSTVRDGLVLDYVGAIDILRKQIEQLKDLGLQLEYGAAAYPPGTTGSNADSFGHVLQSVGLEVACLTDEPTAAAQALAISQGCVVDVGGGTTGISVLQKGKVVYTADEPTGGHHIDLVIAGSYGIDEDEAEALKNDPRRQLEVAPMVRPVFQKMATIVTNHLGRRKPPALYLVGGTCAFPGVEHIMNAETGKPAVLPAWPLLVTPLGIALACLRSMNEPQSKNSKGNQWTQAKFKIWSGK